MQRIDKAVRPPGLIRSAKMYSLLFDTDRLYAIVTGPAGMMVGTIPMFGALSGAVTKTIKKPIENMFSNAYAPKVTAGEERITSGVPAELAKEKDCFAIPYSTISAVEVGTNPVQGPYLKLIFDTKKLQLFFRDKTQAEVESLARNFGREVMVK